ncbi:Hypothetical protein NCS54_01453600 [Fusarium falciforme]|uniref:Hypothetical protein n=1 Tax=Fusarium falciforme TaxID=195108 RepID=UPI002300D914|nr:Hypothetical protein NCS54_01453600 [Fusarium falciforme]WAO96847.1 Hypothetical protein NCS54_01453600 [Fusarium falciforme]
MVRIERFRSTWGVEPGENFEAWKPLFVEWKKLGYGKSTISRLAAHEDFPQAFKSASRKSPKSSLTILPSIDIDRIFSAWHRYRGPRPRNLTPDIHLEGYREELRRAQVLDPVKINAQSGADIWSWEQATYFFKGTIPIDKELGFEGRVCHETHRNRGLFSPYVTDYVLQRVPELRITGDFSHWIVGCERFLDVAEEDQELLDRVIPHVYHIHTRIGTTQSTQCPEPLNPVFAAERAFFEKLWIRIIKSRAQRDPDSVITFVPEYGLFPYHPFGSVRTSADVADSEGPRLQKLFEDSLGD